MLPENPSITLGVLDAVSRDDKVTQRYIATELGIALGLANAYLRRCISKGLIKVKHIPARRYAYYLTRTGFSEKSRLAAEFFSQSVQLFRVARGQTKEILAICHERGFRRVALWGAGDLAEILLLCLSDFPDIEVVGVVAAQPGSMHGIPMAPGLDALPAADAVVVTALECPDEAYQAAIAGFPAHLVLVPPLLGVSTTGRGG